MEALSPKCIFCGFVWKGLAGPQPLDRRCGRCEEELREARDASLGDLRSEVVEAARALVRGDAGVDDLKAKVAALEAAEVAFDAQHTQRAHTQRAVLVDGRIPAGRSCPFYECGVHDDACPNPTNLHGRPFACSRAVSIAQLVSKESP